jgi:predicted phosphodiesterase
MDDTAAAANATDPIDPAAATVPGRSCPIAYRYPPAVLAQPASIHARVLYVVGGLYGNPYALDAVEALAATEAETPMLLFNGDFHWFDTDPATFAAIDRRVAGHRALRGNVETELSGDDDGAGCGCAYPDSVDAGDVERSNRILQRLRGTALGFPQVRERLAALPMFMVAEVGGLRIAVVHGDLQSLSGWSLSEDSLRDPLNGRAMADIARSAAIDIVASTHTCLPVAQWLHPGSGAPVLAINNGAAGMPNFRGESGGLFTRISVLPPPFAVRHGARMPCAVPAGRTADAGNADVHVHAVDLQWPADPWTQRFLHDWPAGSDAHRSYWQRIAHGPAYEPAQADRLAASEAGPG